DKLNMCSHDSTPLAVQSHLLLKRCDICSMRLAICVVYRYTDMYMYTYCSFFTSKHCPLLKDFYKLKFHIHKYIHTTLRLATNHLDQLQRPNVNGQRDYVLVNFIFNLKLLIVIS